MSENKIVAAVVINDKGHILPYTVQATMSQCEEAAIERWGSSTWTKLQDLGCRVVQCEIVLID